MKLSLNNNYAILRTNHLHFILDNDAAYVTRRLQRAGIIGGRFGKLFRFRFPGVCLKIGTKTTFSITRHAVRYPK